MNIQRVEVRREDRLDRILANNLPDSRNRLQAWIESGRVRVDEETVTDKSHRVREGQTVEVSVPPRRVREGVVPESGPLDVVYEDEHLLAVDKPAGMLVHPTSGERRGTLVNRLLYHYPDLSDVGKSHRSGLVHRLDRGTSGVLLVARSDTVLADLKEEFRRRRVKKTYRALLEGELQDRSIEVRVPLSRHPNNPVLRHPDPAGKYALTEIRTVAAADGVTAVRCFPETGRTHQIRVHAQYLGHPVLGDPKYGSGGDERLMLHAARLTFEHPHEGTTTVASNNTEEALPRWTEITSSAP